MRSGFADLRYVLRYVSKVAGFSRMALQAHGIRFTDGMDVLPVAHSRKNVWR
jgi:hypothetical protein